jgi:hypothetical protein
MKRFSSLVLIQLVFFGGSISDTKGLRIAKAACETGSLSTIQYKSV